MRSRMCYDSKDSPPWTPVFDRNKTQTYQYKQPFQGAFRYHPPLRTLQIMLISEGPPMISVVTHSGPPWSRLLYTKILQKTLKLFNILSKLISKSLLPFVKSLMLICSFWKSLINHSH